MGQSANIEPNLPLAWGKLASSVFSYPHTKLGCNLGRSLTRDRCCDNKIRLVGFPGCCIRQNLPLTNGGIGDILKASFWLATPIVHRYH